MVMVSLTVLGSIPMLQKCTMTVLTLTATVCQIMTKTVTVKMRWASVQTLRLLMSASANWLVSVLAIVLIMRPIVWPMVALGNSMFGQILAVEPIVMILLRI